MGSKFKPEEESNQPVEDPPQSEGGTSATSKEKGTSKDLLTKNASTNNENSEQLSKADTSRAISGVTMVTEQSAKNRPTSSKSTSSKTISNSVLSLADSRLSSISKSSPNLNISDKIEADRRVSSAKNGRRQQNGDVKGNKDDAASLSSAQVHSSHQNDSDVTFSKATDDDEIETKNISDKHNISKNNNSESVLKACASILETLRLSSPERTEIGFELPQTAHVSLGDLLSSTPRLQRRLGTAKGRDPTVYAALHGKSPPPRPPTPDLKPKPKMGKSGNRPDLIKDHPRSSSSPKQEQEGELHRELPPVKDVRSPRNDTTSTSLPPVSPPKSPPQDFPPKDENGTNKIDGKRKVALLSYHKNSDADGILCSSNPDVVSPDGSHGSISPRISENGDTWRNNKVCL